MFKKFKQKRLFKKAQKAKTLWLIIEWGQWCATPVPWMGKYDKNGYPLIYIYDDHNGEYEEYYIGSPHNYTSGKVYTWFKNMLDAEKIVDFLNKQES